LAAGNYYFLSKCKYEKITMKYDHIHNQSFKMKMKMKIDNEKIMDLIIILKEIES